MQNLKLRIYPDPVLRKPGEPIEAFDDELREFADGMVELMHAERGIGLAAPQAGVSTRLIVALQMDDPDDTRAEPLVLVNPRILEASGEIWSYEEGCLSIPGINAAVRRPFHVEVEYQDLEGNVLRVMADGMFSRILQHEIDHLDGRLFIDYLSSAQKSLIKSKLRELSEDHKTT
jgi:peptide deformylase